MSQMVKTQRNGQRGGFVLGMIVGLLIGLALALAVALYVTKVPVPFVNKVPQRTAEQDAAELEKNRNWDPNAGLAGKTVAKPVAPPVVPQPAPAPAVGASGAVAAPIAPPIAAFGAASRPQAAPAPAPVERSAKPASQTFQYYVQVGAYTRTDDAEQQRARLAINGLVGRITESEQAGHTMYRVRLGPFDVREDADRAKERAAGVGFSDAALVRVAR
jgi:cell division protein FtsN